MMDSDLDDEASKNMPKREAASQQLFLENNPNERWEDTHPAVRVAYRGWATARQVEAQRIAQHNREGHPHGQQ